MKNVACQKVLMWHNVATSCPAGHKCSTGSIPGQGKLPHNKEEAKKKKKSCLPYQQTKDAAAIKPSTTREAPMVSP